MTHSEYHNEATNHLEQAPISELTARIHIPPDCFEVPRQLRLDRTHTAKYSDMVASSFTEQLTAMANIDSTIPFKPRVNDPLASYNLYRNRLIPPRPSYWQEVDELAAQAGTIDADTTNMRATFVACVALEQETANIYHTLSLYAKLNTQPSRYEILLFLNSYGEHPEREASTRQEIARFQQEHPNIDLRCMNKRLTSDSKLSDIKKLAADAAITRYARASHAHGKHILIFNDADTAYMHPEYLNDYLQHFSDQPNSDAAYHVQDIDLRAFAQLGPEFAFGVRTRQMVERQMVKASGLLFMEGFDTAIRPEVYSAVGGFVPHKPFGVDYTFSRLLMHYRGGTHTTAILRPQEVGIQTSARRAAFKHQQNIESMTNTRTDSRASFILRTQGYGRASELPIEHRMQGEVTRICEHLGRLGVATNNAFALDLLRFHGVDANLEHRSLRVTDFSHWLSAYTVAFDNK